MKITIAGAGSHGSTLAMRIAQAGYADEVVMTDIVEGRAEGLALDMMHSRALEEFRTRVVGTSRYRETAGSAVCVITAGIPRKPGMNRLDLLEANRPIVRDVAVQLAERSPDAVMIVISNPIDEMVALCQKVCDFPPGRVIGEAALLNTARFKYALSEHLDVSPNRVETIVLGSQGETMVPILSHTTVGGRPVRELLDESEIAKLVQEARAAGSEIVAYLKTGSAFYAPSVAAEATVRAIVNDARELVPVSTWLSGAYGISDMHFGVPAELGRTGVCRVVELDLDETELDELQRAALIVKNRLVEAEEDDAAMAAAHTSVVGSRKRHLI